VGQDWKWLWRVIALSAAVILCAIAMRLWTGYPGNPNGENSLNVAIAVVVLTALCRFILFLWSLWKAGNEHPLAAIRGAIPAAAVAFL